MAMVAHGWTGKVEYTSYIDLGEKYQDQGNLLLGRNALLGWSSKHSALQTLIYVSYASTNYLTFKNTDDFLLYSRIFSTSTLTLHMCKILARLWKKMISL